MPFLFISIYNKMNMIPGWSHIKPHHSHVEHLLDKIHVCLLYTSDAADERSSVDLGGRRIIKKKTIESTNLVILDKRE